MTAPKTPAAPTHQQTSNTSISEKECWTCGGNHEDEDCPHRVFIDRSYSQLAAPPSQSAARSALVREARSLTGVSLSAPPSPPSPLPYPPTARPVRHSQQRPSSRDSPASHLLSFLPTRTPRSAEPVALCGPGPPVS
ncbi:hypothetical protein NGA_0240500, partial [Nannochloropsis gaditana CCMP526]|uniref:uncharacterized protein n=1 Tax=Nannochloropsis gaditana (strain CCMP526) TaxID=1093141 RepID=UPI00029F7A36